MDLAGWGPESFVHEADARLRQSIELSAGYPPGWSGQHEAME